MQSLVDKIRGRPGAGRRITALPWRRARQAGRRLGWGAADQAMSSLTNFLLFIYVIRTLGVVEFGAFSLSYVTYGFALNASRGLSTDPLVVRFSGTDRSTWRRAVADCTGTAVAVGLAAGACAIVAGTLLRGATGQGFLALGLTLPALLLQDSWRYSFFALGRAHQAFINDTIWAAVQFPLLVLLKVGGHANVFWFVAAWGVAGAVGAAIGPIQAGVVPSLTGAWRWLSRHRDLGPRYLAEGSASNVANQVRTYGFGLILGLAALGYIQTASTLMGPFRIMFFGMGLLMVPEAVSLLRRSPRHLVLFVVAVSSGLTLLGLAWGAVLLVALPEGLGHLMLGSTWRRAYPLVLPATLWTMGACAASGAAIGLHALAAARRSLRAMLLRAALGIAFPLTGAVVAGPVGAVWCAAAASWLGALIAWNQLRKALREPGTAATARPAAAEAAGDTPPQTDRREVPPSPRNRRPVGTRTSPSADRHAGPV